MLNISVKLDAEKVKKLLARAPEELQRAIGLGSAKLLGDMQQTAQDFLDTPDPKTSRAVTAWGHLVRGIQPEVYYEPPLGGILFVAPPGGDYARPVEEGARPHWLPLTKIPNPRPARLKKDGTPRQRKEEIFAPVALFPWIAKRFPNIDEDQAIPFAFAIRGAIAKRGTHGGAGVGVRFFERTRAKHEPLAAAVYGEYLDEALARLEEQN